MADSFNGGGAPRWFNPSVSTGNLLTLTAGAIAIYAMSIRAEERIAAQGEQIRDLKQEIATIEAQTRSNSLTIATGLRDMGERLVRIETLLRQAVEVPRPRE